MSLLNRAPLSIGRGRRVERDDRCFVVATDDTYAPAQYFEHLHLPRVKVLVLQTPVGSGHSSPGHVVDRLAEAFKNVSQAGDIQSGDEFWLFLDADHHFEGTHAKGTAEALRTARQKGFEVAISKPCFEFWLLLHHVEVEAAAEYPDCEAVERKLREILGEYNKSLIKPAQFPLARLADAIRRARALEESREGAEGRWPQRPGSRVYRLMERILQGRA